MPKLIFINLPVTDLDRSIAFYAGVGAKQNLQFSDDAAACMVVSDTIHVMLLTHEKYRQFTSREIPDARKVAQALLTISEESREAVDARVDKATAAGGTADPSPVDDHGFMYGRGFEDPNGHLWGVMWMDPAALADGPPAA